MKTYFAIVHHDPESAFGVEFPDWPGVFSAADDQGDLIANAAEALQLAAEDAATPKPSAHLDLLAREDVRAALAEGAFLLIVPFIERDAAVEQADKGGFKTRFSGFETTRA